MTSPDRMRAALRDVPVKTRRAWVRAHGGCGCGRSVCSVVIPPHLQGERLEQAYADLVTSATPTEAPHSALAALAERVAALESDRPTVVKVQIGERATVRLPE